MRSASTRRLGAEVAPLGEELNALLDHQQRMVARARTSAQDLAHALKTPLSVLATEADSDGTGTTVCVRAHACRPASTVTWPPGRRPSPAHRRGRCRAGAVPADGTRAWRTWHHVHGGRHRSGTAVRRRQCGSGGDAGQPAGQRRALGATAGRHHRRHQRRTATHRSTRRRPGRPQSHCHRSPSAVCGWMSARAAAGWAWQSWAISPPAAGAWRWRMYSRACARRCGCRWGDATNPTVGSAGRWPAST